ncbi:MAG: hypothetical protein KC593_16295 [Myxococcales bacterium]|nr:hypothetical protein [Myxococcales bacterium]
MLALLVLGVGLAVTHAEARPLRPEEAARRDSQAPTTVIARLAHLGADTAPRCGTQHIAVVMRYEVLQVIGAQPYLGPSGNQWDVIHGCPELSRARYRAGSGDVESFRLGDVHRLVLSLRAPDSRPDSVLDMWPRTSRNPPLWALRADRASAP